jgi:hypothetical protein
LRRDDRDDLEVRAARAARRARDAFSWATLATLCDLRNLKCSPLSLPLSSSKFETMSVRTFNRDDSPIALRNTATVVIAATKFMKAISPGRTRKTNAGAVPARAEW